MEEEIWYFMGLCQNKLPLSLMFAVSKGQIFSCLHIDTRNVNDLTNFLAEKGIYSSKDIYK